MKLLTLHRIIEVSLPKILVLAIVFTSNFVQGSSGPEENDFNEKLLQSDFVDGPGFSWLEEPDRKRAVDILTMMLLNEKSSNQQVRSDIELRLLAAGDAEITSKIVAKYLAGDRDSENNLARYGRESALQHFMQNVENGGTKERGGDDNYWESEMDGATIRILGIIEKSNSFPQKTKKWAEYLGEAILLRPGYGGPSGKATQEVRQWWSNNRLAVLRGEYERATWLPTRATGPESRPRKNIAAPIEQADPENGGNLRNPHGHKSRITSTLWLEKSALLVALMSIIAILLWQFIRKSRST